MTILKQINVCCTSGVKKDEYGAVIYGLEKILNEVGSELIIRSYGSKVYKDYGDYCSPDWYQNKALTKIERGYGQQVNAVVISDLLLTEPYQMPNPHYDLFITDKDLRLPEEENNFVFGINLLRTNVLSIRRLRGYKNSYAAIAVLTAHEFGHNKGLVTRNVNAASGGYKTFHCKGEKGPCLMEQVNVRGCRDIIKQAELVYPLRNWLCADCKEETRLNKTRSLINRIPY